MQTAYEAMGTVQIILAIGTPVATVAGAYFALKFGLNGTKRDIADTRNDVGKISDGIGALKEGQTEVRIKVAEIATDLKETKGWVGSIDNRLDRHIELDS